MAALAEFVDNIAWLIYAAVIPLLIGVAIVAFLWGVYKYFILGGANEEQRHTGRGYILYAIIGFVVIFSMWGIIQVFITSFGLETGGAGLKFPAL